MIDNLKKAYGDATKPNFFYIKYNRKEEPVSSTNSISLWRTCFSPMNFLVKWRLTILFCIR